MWPRRAALAEAEPESAPASTARAALKQLLSEITEATAKAVRLAEIDRQRLDAEREEAAAQAGLDAVAAGEREDMQAWSRGGCLGAPPQPRADQRAAAQQRAAGAKARAEAARHTAGAAQEQLHATNTALAKLEARRRPLVAAVLVEHAREIAARYSAALGAAVRHEIVLSALRRQLADLGCVEDGMAVALMMREGAGPNPTMSKIAAATLRRQIAAFVQQLTLNADASFPTMESYDE